MGLYDLNSDPMEVINLAHDQTDKLGELADTLDRWISSNIPEGQPDPMFVASEQRRQATGEKEGWEGRPRV